MNQFEIQTQKTNEQIDFIVCQAKDLRIKVIPPNKQPKVYGPDQMIISANFFARFPDGSINPGKTLDYDFEIIEQVVGYVNKAWSMELFYNAIEYYCQLILDKEPDGFSYINNFKFYPYGGE